MSRINRKQLSYLLYSLVISWLCIGKVQATWYEASGMARIHHGDIEQARQEAVRSAVKDALLYAGASVTSAQQVTNGLLTQDMFEVRASGVINEIEIVDENITDRGVEVIIRTDIFADERQCFTTDYRKSLSLLPFQIKHNEHAKIGSIYNLPHQVTENVRQRIIDATTSIDFRSYLTETVNIEQADSLSSINMLRPVLSEVARQTDSQYIVTGQITDLSMAEDSPKGMSEWLGTETSRYFDMDIYILDGFTGELISQLEYTGEADWQFSHRKTVDVSSRRFWNSDYGLVITDQINRAVGEIDALMKCQPVTAQVVDINDTSIRFNLGKSNGVQLGDRFKVLHKGTFTDPNGKQRPQFIVSNYEVEVTQVYGHSAVAKTPTEYLLGNVQIGDVIKQTSF